MKEQFTVKSISLSIAVILAVRGLYTFIDMPVRIEPHETIGFTIDERAGVQTDTVFEAAEDKCEAQGQRAIRLAEMSNSTRAHNQIISFTTHHFVCINSPY